MPHKASYKIKTKRETLMKLNGRSVASVSRDTGIPASTIGDWRDHADEIFAYTGSERNKTLGGQGGAELIPFAHELVVFMKDQRRGEEVLSSIHMIGFIKAHVGDPWWLVKDGVKLPILFILKGKPGGTIENEELPTYPMGHFYTVQANAWMNNATEHALTRLGYQSKEAWGFLELVIFVMKWCTFASSYGEAS
ncbi:hypothetical protein ATCC90586_011549 [Pythium insidiosum]|nr:hypothetical protein ATCC90586_011549 [Pythium insidiosum]